MLVRPLLAIAAFAALFAPVTPAGAADVAAPAFALCGPPPAALAAQVVAPGFRGWLARGDYPRITNVERFDPHHPPTAVVPKYVIPQTAYLASSLCDYPDGAAARGWYDGKLFYIPGGNRAAPDAFMVIERK